MKTIFITGQAGIVTTGAKPTGNLHPEARDKIKAFSGNSSRRMARYLAVCCAEYRNMVTLTIPNIEADGKAFKAAVDRFLRWAIPAMDGPAETKSAFWFLEFQDRGAPHLHLLVTGFIHKDKLSEKWAMIWAQSLFDRGVLPYNECAAVAGNMMKTATRVEALRGSRLRACAYACKYARKGEQKVVPPSYEDVGRFWGVRGLRAVVAATTFAVDIHAIDHMNSPEFLSKYWIDLTRQTREWGIKCRCIDWKMGGGATFILDMDGMELQSAVTAMVNLFFRSVDTYFPMSVIVKTKEERHDLSEETEPNETEILQAEGFGADMW